MTEMLEWFSVRSTSSGKGKDDTGTGTPGGGGVALVPTRLNLTAREVYRSYGVASHPQRRDTNYAGTAPGNTTLSTANIDRWFQTLHDTMGVFFVRGHYVYNHNGVAHLATRMRAAGDMQWLMEVCAEGNGATPIAQTVAHTITEVEHISTNNAGICYGIEGPNEPNHNRSGTATVVADWANQTMDHQMAIWNTAKSKANLADKDIVSPSIHDVANDNSYTAAKNIATATGVPYNSVRPRGFVSAFAALPAVKVVGDTYLIAGTQNNYTWDGSTWRGPYVSNGGIKHWHQLARLGLNPLSGSGYCNWIGLHSYPAGGGIPETKVGERLTYIDEAFGPGVPVWLTEIGYNNAVNLARGATIVSEKAAGRYGPRFAIQFIAGYGQGSTAKRKMRVTRFDTLDQWNPALDAVEDNYGVIAVNNSLTEVQSYNPATWRDKPEVFSVKAFLDNVREPFTTPAYTATPTYLEVAGPATLQWAVVTMADGSKKVCLWNNVSVYNNVATPAQRRDLTPLPVTATITDPTRTWTVQVNADPIFVGIAQ